MALDFPASPTNGQTFTGPNGVLWGWDGAKWVGTPSPPTGIVVAASPPSFSPGKLWWDSTGGQLYIGFDDGNSQQWVVASNVPGLANAATKTDVAGALSNVGRNVLHNSLFAVAQRGTGPFTVAGYTLDRWKLDFNLDADSVSQYAMNDGNRAQMGDEAAIYGLGVSCTGNAGAASYTRITQLIEGVRRLAGKTITVSFYASCSSGTPKVGVSWDQVFGTGGSPSGTVIGNGQSVTISTTGTRYSLTFTLPSAAGMTLGTNGNDCTLLAFWLSAGSTQNVRAGSIGVQTINLTLWGVQCEVGSQATPLEKPDPRYDLANCQRFYCTGYIVWGGYGLAGGGIQGGGTFPTSMRNVPQMTVAGAVNYTNCSGLLYNFNTSQNFSWQANVTATAYTYIASNWTASADL